MSKEEKEVREVTICLEESKIAHGFDSNENVHYNNFERVKQIIRKQVSKLDTPKDKFLFSVEHQYNTISIFGGRGTGKTTFILSLLRNIEQEYKDEAQILNIVDPTQMEEKEHIFLVILSLIDNVVREKIEQKKKMAAGDSCCEERGWNHKLSSLAKGLPTLDGLNKSQYENWDDNWYIVESGINNVKSAYDLEKNFHELVDEALKIIGKKFFVLAFDDTDVDFSKGWHILETIRKYLTSPKLVIFLSGNLTLYSFNVRLQQWKQFKELKDFEGHDYKGQVNQLEGQYLLKVLKPENRIQLRSLLDYKRTYNTSYIIKEKGKEIGDAYSDLLVRLGIHRSSTQRTFIDYLLGLSIRSQISILSDYTEPDIMSQINVYVSRMMAAGIDVDLAVKNPVFTLISIVDYLAKSNLFPHSYLLIPNTEKHDVNGVLMGLTTILANQTKQDPWVIFDFMLRVGYTRYLNLQLSEDRFRQMLEYSGIMQDMSIKNIVILMAGVGKANHLNLPELIPLEVLANGKEEKRNAKDNLLKVEGASVLQRVLALIPLFSLKKGQQKKTYLYYSVLPLLSTICKIFRSGDDELSVKNILRDFSLHRTYPMPSHEEELASNPEDEIQTNEELSQSLNIDMEDETVNGLIREILDWKKSFVNTNEHNSSFLIPPYLLGRIMTRFTFALINVSKKENLGELYQQHLIILLNSVLVEETNEKFGKKVNINNNNPTGSTLLFTQNLDRVAKVDNENGDNNTRYLDSLYLTRCFLSCPLIHEFLEKKVSVKVQECIGKDLHISEKSLYEILERYDGKIDITIDNLNESVDRIINEAGSDFFLRLNLFRYDKEFYDLVQSLPFVKSVDRRCLINLRGLLKMRNPLIKTPSLYK